MKRMLCIAACLLLLAGAAIVALRAFPDPVSRAKQAVVGVLEGLDYDAEGNAYSVHSDSSYATGTAFGVSPPGGDAQYFVTNCHVVTGSDRSVRVHLLIDGSDIRKGATVIPCEVVYADEEADLAILRAAYPVEGVGTLALRPVEAGLSGEHVYALGFPGIEDLIADENRYTMGDITVTDGIVSRLLTTDGVRAFSHTAKINHGNSGGPLVDDYGQALGVNSWGISDLETADKRDYAVCSDYAIEALKTLGVAYQAGGSRPYLGGVLAAAGLTALAIALLILAIGKPGVRMGRPVATLRALNGPLAGQAWPVYECLSLGRGGDQDVRLPDATRGVSRAHCVLRRQGGELTLTDLDSTCGTLLNGKRLAANQPVPVKPGAILCLGGEAVSFQVEQAH